MIVAAEVAGDARDGRGTCGPWRPPAGGGGGGGGGYRSAQAVHTVNLMALPSQVRILHPPVRVESQGSRVEGRKMVALDPGPAALDPSGGCSSMVEQQPSKLMTRVRFPSPAHKSRESRVKGQETEGMLFGSRRS